MDAQLVGIASTQTAVRLAIGDAFVLLGNGWQELGFSSFGGYVRERCERSARWGEETRAVAARLGGLPRIRARLASGAMGWCMAALLSRFATSEDEEELLEATRGMTVRQLKQALHERGGPEPRAEEAARFGTLYLTMTYETAWALEATRPMVELVDGRSESGAWLEAMLAEGQCAFTNVAPGVDPTPDDIAARQAEWLASIDEGRRQMDRREERAEGGLPPMPKLAVAPVVDDLPTEPLRIDGLLARELAPRLASSDQRFGELLGRFFAVRGWRVLGFASETQYARERLGMSRSAARSRITLARRARHLEAVGDALRDGAIGYEAASLIARVATPDSAAEWVERATMRTTKHLREEVCIAEQIARMMRPAEPPRPPTVEEVQLVQALEADAKCGAFARRAFGVERDDDAPPPVDALSDEVSEVYSAMAEEAMVVGDALRTVIGRVRGSSLSAEEAIAACLGAAAPGAEVPTIGLEGDLTHVSDAPTAVSATVDAIAESGEGATHADGAAVPTFGDESAVTFDEAQAGRAAVQMFGDRRAITLDDSRVGSAAIRMFGDELASTASDGSAGEAVAPRRRLGKVTLRVRAREEVILHFRMLQAAFERAGLGDDFVSFLVLAFWSSWAEVLGRTSVWETVLRRDRYLCTSPVCDRPCESGTHHIVYRAHGGGDEPTNNTGGCKPCHLDGVHAGRIRVTGLAPDLTWVIGQPPIMIVHRRERRLVA